MNTIIVIKKDGLDGVVSCVKACSRKKGRTETNRERKFQGENWPGSYWPIRSRERIVPVA